MTSQDILDLLSKSIDESLSESETIKLDQAVEQEPELNKIKDQLMKNKEMCLQCMPETPELFETKLLERAIGLSDTRRPRIPQWAQWLIPLAAVAALMWFLMPVSSTTDIPSESNLLEQLASAQQVYTKAISALEERAHIRLEQLPPHLQTTFRENLDIIDRAIANCESVSMGNEMQLYVFKTLSSAYEAKTRLLEQIINS